MYNVLYKTQRDSTSPAVALDVPYMDAESATYITQDVANRILRKKLEMITGWDNDGWCCWEARDTICHTITNGMWEWLACENATAPMIITGRNCISPTDRKIISPTTDIREQRARETLLLIIGLDKFRSFLRNGFVTAQNRRSGRVYQIFSEHGITCVYENGRMIERLCVVLKGDFPSTDGVIVRYLMALNNEDQLWSLSIKHGVRTHQSADIRIANYRPLQEIYAELQGRKVA